MRERLHTLLIDKISERCTYRVFVIITLDEDYLRNRAPVEPCELRLFPFRILRTLNGPPFLWTRGRTWKCVCHMTMGKIHRGNEISYNTKDTREHFLEYRVPEAYDKNPIDSDLVNSCKEIISQEIF